MEIVNGIFGRFFVRSFVFRNLKKFGSAENLAGAYEIVAFRRKSRVSAKISNFGENLEFRRKSRVSAKISNFGENLGSRRKSRTPAKIVICVVRQSVSTPMRH